MITDAIAALIGSEALSERHCGVVTVRAGELAGVIDPVAVRVAPHFLTDGGRFERRIAPHVRIAGSRMPPAPISRVSGDEQTDSKLTVNI